MDEMPRGGRGGQNQPPRRPVDLTGTISIAEKNGLTVLVNEVTDKIHNEISGIFDSTRLSSFATEYGHHNWLGRSMLPINKENMPPPSSQPSSLARGDGSERYNQTHQLLEKEEKESLSPQLSELKKEALTLFRKWQNTLLHRMRDIVVNDPNNLNANFRGRGRGTRGGPVRGRGRATVNVSSKGMALPTGAFTQPPCFNTQVSLYSVSC